MGRILLENQIREQLGRLGRQGIWLRLGTPNRKISLVGVCDYFDCDSKFSGENMSETWKQIPNFPGYEASNQGRVRSLARTVSHWRGGTRNMPEKILKGISNRGYLVVKLGAPNKAYGIHQCVMAAFHGWQSGKVVNHINAIKTDNRLENLEYVTNSENVHHAYQHGLMRVAGEDNGLRKIDNATAIAILSADPAIHPKDLAAKLNCSPNIVKQVRAGKTWRHVAALVSACVALLCGSTFGGQFLLPPELPLQPTLAPACQCHGPSDPKCVCGKSCQCVPATPAPKVSVMKPPAPKYICENGVCRPVQAPASTISPWGPYGPGQEKSPISAIEIQKQKNEDQCERDYLETMRKYYPSQQGAASAYPNGVCRPAQSPVPAKAAPKVESRTAPTVQAGGCSSCSGVRSYPVRRGLFGWRR